MKKILMSAGAAVFALSTAATAATLSIVGGTAATIPGGSQTNEIIADQGHVTLGGFFGSQIVLDESTELVVELLGFEAGFQNVFTLGGSGFDTEDFPSNLVLPSSFGGVLPSYQFDAIAGLLGFLFTTSGDDDTIDNDVANGDTNENTAGHANFFATFGDMTTRTGTSLTLYFDDTGGFGDDDNHDDLAIRISVVPLPGAAIPLLTAVAGLGWVGRRRRKAAKA